MPIEKPKKYKELNKIEKDRYTLKLEKLNKTKIPEIEKYIRKITSPKSTYNKEWAKWIAKELSTIIDSLAYVNERKKSAVLNKLVKFIETEDVKALVEAKKELKK
ncbi:MAG TPA: hypothetical protein PKK56_01520 [archaeon]|nr:hypothetical protein [archaeon]HPC10347.1 hypothetical protein [archaeon]HRT02340.1 hypothetical protein [Candidatus Diapherotrites archaeon]